MTSIFSVIIQCCLLYVWTYVVFCRHTTQWRSYYGRYVYISIFYAFFYSYTYQTTHISKTLFFQYMFNYFIYIFYFNIHCTSTCSSTTTTTTKTHQDSGHVFLVGGSFCSFLMFLFFIFIMFFFLFDFFLVLLHTSDVVQNVKKKFNRTLIIVLRYVFIFTLFVASLKFHLIVYDIFFIHC